MSETLTPEEHLARAQEQAAEQRVRNAKVAARAAALPSKPAIPERLMLPRKEAP